MKAGFSLRSLSSSSYRNAVILILHTAIIKYPGRPVTWTDADWLIFYEEILDFVEMYGVVADGYQHHW